MDVDNWDLQAVVKGCCLTKPSTDPFSSFPPPVLKEEQVDGEKDILFDFPDIIDTGTSFHELEELCKPFFLKPHQKPWQQQQQQQSLLSPQQNSPSQQQPRLPQRPVTNTPRSKRRKNQQKRLVCHVPNDGLHSDMWAWRKYGQKPIKGSPYPRCSSSKGCLARKQVERSRTDPEMLVVTYTAEHNHPLPTHRNSLAGSTRQKKPLPPSHAATSPSASGSERIPSSIPPSSSVRDELLQQKNGMEEEDEEEEEMLTVGDLEMAGEEDVVFLGLERLVEGTDVGAAKLPVLSDFYADESGLAEHFFASAWLATNNAAAAAGGN